ncbi:hypothetical protein AYI69_g5137 [Smittium culicis]|uniref:Uncharacterized protein n=1 Tax=Smittium culicis TaxID=133412 RepID=A0A1R1Y7X2_9FUNG|nr:hypothetical protein AYI69_g5137 [Smittium culicis]
MLGRNIGSQTSRTIHENGTKHKLNVQQYLQTVDLDKKKEIKESNKVSNILSSIEKAANKSFLEDAASGIASSSDYIKAQAISTIAATRAEQKSKTKQPNKPQNKANNYQPDPLINFGFEDHGNQDNYAGIKDTAGLGPWVPVNPTQHQYSQESAVQPNSKSSMSHISHSHSQPENQTKRAYIDDDEDDPDDLDSFNLDSKTSSYKSIIDPTSEKLSAKETSSTPTASVFKKRKKPTNIISKPNPLN